jgi:hypothetical protein
MSPFQPKNFSPLGFFVEISGFLTTCFFLKPLYTLMVLQMQKNINKSKNVQQLTFGKSWKTWAWKSCAT